MRRFARLLTTAVPALALVAACGGAAPAPAKTPGATGGAPTAPPSAQPSAASTPVPTSKQVGRIAFTWTAAGSDVNNISTIAADGTDERVLTSSPTVASEGVEWIPGSDRLLFDSNRVKPVHLFTMDGRGGDVRQLTFGDRFEGYPSFAPDGSTIVFDDSTEKVDLGLTLIDAHGKNPRRVTKPAAPAIDSLPAFSPDGKRIAFERILDGTHGQARTAIFVVNVDGTGLKQLTDWATNASYPNWSPDGSKIVFSDNADNGGAEYPLNVWTINPDGTGLRLLTHAAAGAWAHFGADWSPDGSRIVYVAGGTALEEMDPDGTNVATIWNAKPDIYIDDPDWGPTN
jgi:TolB protein